MVRRLEPFSSWSNSAYILLLIRDGVVKTEDDLMRHFGCGIYRTITELIDGEAHIEDTLRKLSDAGLIDCQAGDLKVTPLLKKIQTSLQLSLSALASGEPGERLIVSPRHRMKRQSSCQSDIFVLMPFAEALTALSAHLW
jgi:hypothetical protein